MEANGKNNWAIFYWLSVLGIYGDELHLLLPSSKKGQRSEPQILTNIIPKQIATDSS